MINVLYIIECFNVLLVMVWCDIVKFDELGKLCKVCNGVECIEN